MNTSVDVPPYEMLQNISFGDVFSYSLLAAVASVLAFWYQNISGSITRREFYFRCFFILLVYLETRLRVFSGSGTSCCSPDLGRLKTSKAMVHVALAAAIFAACVLSPGGFPGGGRTGTRPMAGFAAESSRGGDGNERSVAGSDSAESSNKTNFLRTTESESDGGSESDSSSTECGRCTCSHCLSRRSGFSLRPGRFTAQVGPRPSQSQVASKNSALGRGVSSVGNADAKSASFCKSNAHVNFTKPLDEITESSGTLQGGDGRQEGHNVQVNYAKPLEQITEDSDGLTRDENEGTWGPVQVINDAVKGIFATAADQQTAGNEEVLKARVQIRRKKRPPPVAEKQNLRTTSSSELGEGRGYPFAGSEIGHHLCPPDPCTKPQQKIGGAIGAMSSCCGGGSKEEKEEEPNIKLENNVSEKPEKHLVEEEVRKLGEEGSLSSHRMVTPFTSAEAPIDVWFEEPKGHDWRVHERRKVVTAIDKTYFREVNTKKYPPIRGDEDIKEAEHGYPEGQKGNESDTQLDDFTIGSSKYPPQRGSSPPRSQSKSARHFVRSSNGGENPFYEGIRSRGASPFQKTVIRPSSVADSFPPFTSRQVPINAPLRPIRPMDPGAPVVGNANRPLSYSQPQGTEDDYKKFYLLSISIGVFLTACYLISQKYGSFDEFLLHWTKMVNSKPCSFYVALYGFIAGGAFIWKRSQENKAKSTEDDASKSSLFFLSVIVEIVEALVLLKMFFPNLGQSNDFSSMYASFSESLQQYDENEQRDSRVCCYGGFAVLVAFLFWLFGEGDEMPTVARLDPTTGTMVQQNTEEPSMWERMFGKAPKERIKFSYEYDIQDHNNQSISENFDTAGGLRRLPQPKRRLTYSSPAYRYSHQTYDSL